MKECPGIVMPCENDCPKVGYGFVPIQDVNLHNRQMKRRSTKCLLES